MVSQHALQVSRPTARREVKGSDLGGSPDPHPGGKLRGLAWGGLQAHTQEEVEGSALGGLPAHNQEEVEGSGMGGSPGPHPGRGLQAPQQMVATAGGTHPTGMRSR